MKSRPIVTALVGFFLVLTSAASARAQGSVTNVTLSPRTNIAGGTISVTATGTNPCGAARINYGDGEAITYALTALPVTQTHVYPKAGTYTITVEGMGNCGGAPTTTLTITNPPAPPPARARRGAEAAAAIEAVEITPMPARVQEPVSVIVRGTGSCAYDVVYGDGTAEQVNARLPEDSHHTYAKAGRYVVIVRPQAPCAGKFTQVLAVDDAVSAATPARITHVLASPSPGTAGVGISIAVHGSGTCAYDVYYGDGRTEAVNAPLPAATQHVYERAGRYAVVVKPQAPCSGKFTEMLQVADATAPPPAPVRSSAARVTRVSARPVPAAARQPVRLTIDGFGTCTFKIDYGDGNSESRSMSLPGALRHVYSTPDYYTVVVTPDDPCRGWGRVSIDVRGYGR